MESESQIIFKVVSSELWSRAEATGVFEGAEIDLTDGFIHFSTPLQVRETVEKHFGGQAGLLIVAVDANKLGDQLKYEPSRGGDLFPHLYEPLKLDTVVSVNELPIGKDGRHLFPDGLTLE